MTHGQLIPRNAHDLADVICIFHELNDCYENQFVISSDSHTWELFHTRVAKTIISHKFKHYNQFRADMRKLLRDIINVGCVRIRLGRNSKPKPTEVWSIKAIINHYGFEDNYFFNNNLIN